MFCPRCGQEQISNETRFCSRCGFLMTGVADLVAHRGNVQLLNPTNFNKEVSPRKKGLKQGLFIFLLTFLVVPLVAMISVWLHLRPFGIPITAILFFMGGILRMVYALLFESDFPQGEPSDQNMYQNQPTLLMRKQNLNALPPQQSVPVDSYMPPVQGNWRDTNDLTPTTVTENTTKLLQKEEK